MNSFSVGLNRDRSCAFRQFGAADMNRISVVKQAVPVPAIARQRVQEGRPFPLGATWDGLGVNFALFSANASKVELCLFDLEGKQELERIELPEYTDEVWHG